MLKKRTAKEHGGKKRKQASELDALPARRETGGMPIPVAPGRGWLLLLSEKQQ